jgi:hypothetical protein
VGADEQPGADLRVGQAVAGQLRDLDFLDGQLLAGCPAGTVTLDAGGADTCTQRAIPGSEPSQDFPRGVVV